ncbi:cytochrome P450 [Roseimicrobium sp. ORNL1]|uniref:cytochrome P450 n=1 Tax=Roseimicrobium sp. ORNL1 TaxID=2711231 RepID=UPI0013E1E6F1|nr:cytochrome P450 [Roseimicrobium sp. ORNL1]QIF01299.1 cytochrome P450 [Roseimicrobium sp. ORNL1]
MLSNHLENTTAVGTSGGSVHGGSPYDFLLEMMRDRAGWVKYDSSYGEVYFFGHPDYVQSVVHNAGFVRTSLGKLLLGNSLLTSDGHEWRAKRQLLQPHFHERCMAAHDALITGRTMDMLRRWEPIADGHTLVDLSAETECVTLEILMKALFGGIPAGDAAKLAAAVRMLMQELGDLSDALFMTRPVVDSARNARFRKALQLVDGMVADIIARWENMEHRECGMMASLLAVRDDEGNQVAAKQVRDEVVTMIMAGQESAVSLLWTTHLVAKHPEVEQRLLEEMDAVLGERIPTVADFPKLEYTRMVVDEALRLYPPVSVVVRQAATDLMVHDVHVPAKSLVVVSPYATHRHPDFWEEPERFHPERFQAGRMEGLHRYAYFPFFGGRHRCIGQPLALIEGPLMRVLMTRHYRICPLPDHDYQPLPGMVMRLRGGYPAHLELRRSVPRAEPASCPFEKRA